MNVVPVRSGAVVARRYRATSRIASGAMGEVWEGVHVELGHRVALKVLREDALESREMLVRFAREAFLLSRIQSEHVVRAIDFVPRSRHGPVLVMELVEGPTFADWVHQGPVAIEPTIDVAIDVLRGLCAMHACHVIHRDVKPGNVVLRRMHDGSRRAVLIDLGVGRLLSDADGHIPNVGFELTTDDRVVGTLEYMAPEQILSCQTAAESVDVYAVGTMIFRAITGTHPFADKKGVDLLREKVNKPVPRFRCGRNDAIGKKLEAIVARGVAFSPKDRYQSAAEFLAELEELRAEMRSASAALGSELSAQLATARTRRRRAVIALAAVCATAFAACSTGLVRHAPAATQTVDVAVTSRP